SIPSTIWAARSPSRVNGLVLGSGSASVRTTQTVRSSKDEMNLMVSPFPNVRNDMSPHVTLLRYPRLHGMLDPSTDSYDTIAFASIFRKTSSLPIFRATHEKRHNSSVQHGLRSVTPCDKSRQIATWFDAVRHDRNITPTTAFARLLLAIVYAEA